MIMPKFFKNLILVWTVVCASGLGIFLFQIYGPALEPQTTYEGTGVAMSVGFFVFLWLVPVGIMTVAGRRRKDRD
ncbi:MAG: hypothetical protein ACYC29_01765 [Thermoleophilia bacterium]